MTIEPEREPAVDIRELAQRLEADGYSDAAARILAGEDPASATAHVLDEPARYQDAAHDDLMEHVRRLQQRRRPAR